MIALFFQAKWCILPQRTLLVVGSVKGAQVESVSPFHTLFLAKTLTGHVMLTNQSFFLCCGAIIETIKPEMTGNYTQWLNQGEYLDLVISTECFKKVCKFQLR